MGKWQLNQVRFPATTIAVAALFIALLIWLWTTAAQQPTSVVVIEHSANPATAIAPPPDERLSDPRLTQWLDARNAGVPSDESRLQQLAALLQQTTAAPPAIFAVGQNLTGSGRVGDRLAGRYFLTTAVRRVQAELSRLTPDPAAAPYLQMLWTFCDSAAVPGNWDLQRDIYGTLAQWEPPGTVRLYRARLKYADFLLYSGDPGKGLAVMDSLMADISAGQYPMANPHDIVPLYWMLCHNSNHVEQGLAYLRSVVKKSQGTSDEQKMTAQLIGALAESGHAAEAKRLWIPWQAAYGSIASPQTVNQLAQLVAIAQAQEDHPRAR